MLTDLIHRIETAPGKDRTLFEEAFAAAFGVHPQLAQLQGRADPEKSHIARRFLRMLDDHAYLDAAMMLVPEGLAWILYSDGPTYNASAEIGPHPEPGRIMEGEYVGEAPTPALALASAALKARIV